MSNLFVDIPEGVAALLIIRSTFNHNGLFITKRYSIVNERTTNIEMYYMTTTSTRPPTNEELTDNVNRAKETLIRALVEEFQRLDFI
jgi:hypothetical protein